MNALRRLPRRLQRWLIIAALFIMIFFAQNIRSTVKLEVPLKVSPPEQKGSEVQKIYRQDELTVTKCLKLYLLQPSYPDLVECILDFNEASPIRNEERFPVVSSIVFVLLAHKRTEYLREVVNSLRKMDGIGNVTLVVSHDGYFPDVEDIIATIDFCRVKKVYHPFSASLTMEAFSLFPEFSSSMPNSSVFIKKPDIFSGTSKENPYILSYNFATSNTSFISDPHLKQTAPKHHYWWLWNYIFTSGTSIPGLGRPDSVIMHLEEDHIVSSDALKFLQASLELKPIHCPECLMVNIGNHDKTGHSNGLFAYQKSPPRNIGLTFGAPFFKWLMAHKTDFCSLNEYNWDATLSNFAADESTRIVSFAAFSSRVKHIGSCGMHSTARSCDPSSIINEFRQFTEERVRAFEYSTSQPNVNIHPAVYASKGALNDGWTTGQIKTSNFWKSSINSDHCMSVSNGFGIIRSIK